MAKKSTKKAPAEKTTTYSTRLNEDQKTVLEEAAAIKGISASKFIRDAALQAAVDTVNAHGSNDAAILSSLLSLADVLKRPEATVTFHSDEIDHSTERKLILDNNGTSLAVNITDDNGNDLHFYPVSIRGESLTSKQLNTLRDIAASCPITFSETFRRAIDGVNGKQLDFTPKANANTVIDD
jgi:uncharacterized protein (DUF1778 family)